MNDLEIIHDFEELILEVDGLDTQVYLSDTYDSASIALSWAEAMRLHKWLGERLGGK